MGVLKSPLCRSCHPPISAVSSVSEYHVIPNATGSEAGEPVGSQSRVGHQEALASEGRPLLRYIARREPGVRGLWPIRLFQGGVRTRASVGA